MSLKKIAVNLCTCRNCMKYVQELHENWTWVQFRDSGIQGFRDSGI
ncbi:hypothetical protein D1AOALGA4SA_12216 [Olavius algarvensis Delta 1 endosymbiont]|nr:hypothetical protein D1AOALGA4SA_12216 [Olavius algarvensis Delta 1 endosymbiont]